MCMYVYAVAAQVEGLCSTFGFVEAPVVASRYHGMIAVAA